MVKPLDHIPSDLVTPEEAAMHLDGSGLTGHNLVVWTRRTKNIPPHFRFNKHTVRFSMATLEDWLRERSKIRRRS